MPLPGRIGQQFKGLIMLFKRYNTRLLNILTLSMPAPKNRQTHSNNLAVTADELLECV